MKTIMITAAVCGALTLGALGTAAPAAAADSFSLSFDPGGVAFAYNDGYWDHDHHWHRWHNGREARYYREHYGERWHAWRHDRDHDLGWRDDDGDGIPNRYDRHPENPYRP